MQRERRNSNKRTFLSSHTIHGAAGFSNESGEDECNIEAQKNQGGGTLTEEAKREGEGEGEGLLGIAPINEIEEEVCDVKTLGSAAR